MTRKEREDAINYFKNKLENEVYGAKYNKLAIEALKQESKAVQFAEWVASEIIDEELWEYNYEGFAEIACRKLEKLGIVRANGNEWELVEPQERSDKK